MFPCQGFDFDVVVSFLCVQTPMIWNSLIAVAAWTVKMKPVDSWASSEQNTISTIGNKQERTNAGLTVNSPRTVLAAAVRSVLPCSVVLMGVVQDYDAVNHQSRLQQLVFVPYPCHNQKSCQSVEAYSICRSQRRGIKKGQQHINTPCRTTHSRCSVRNSDFSL